MEAEGRKSLSLAMREAGYPKTTAKNPQTLARSKTWQELMDKYIPEKTLMKVAKEGLKANSVRFSPEGELLEFPDHTNRHRFFETGLKLRGKLKDDGEVSKTNILIISGESAQRYGVTATTASNAEDSSTRSPQIQSPELRTEMGQDNVSD